MLSYLTPQFLLRNASNGTNSSGFHSVNNSQQNVSWGDESSTGFEDSDNSEDEDPAFKALTPNQKFQHRVMKLDCKKEQLALQCASIQFEIKTLKTSSNTDIYNYSIKKQPRNFDRSYYSIFCCGNNRTGDHIMDNSVSDMIVEHREKMKMNNIEYLQKQ